jgi:hypothetical protein
MLVSNYLSLYVQKHTKPSLSDIFSLFKEHLFSNVAAEVTAKKADNKSVKRILFVY